MDALVGAGDSPRHYRSQARLLQSPRDGDLPLGGILVSAGRHASHLGPALRLGADLGVPVVLMCSRKAQPAEAAEAAAQVPGVHCAVVDLSEPPPDPFPPFETSGFREALVGSHGDLSRKRNLGLVLARLAGWPTLLFLDDDIDGLKPALVRRAAGALEHHTAVGMPARDYPDNSVVCHARRFIPNGRQGVFVAGSALAVNVDRADSFFPETYNEDWLFLAPHLDRRDVVALGSVRQLPYDPFELPDRATAEEFGDVLAEGLIGHLHRNSLESPPTVAEWAAFLERRRRFIAEAAESCANRAADDPEAAAALRALERADWSRARLVPEFLAAYVTCWLRDLRRWRCFLASIPRCGGLGAALDQLRLPATSVTTGLPDPSLSTAE